MLWRLIEWFGFLLEDEREREAVLGDLAERGPRWTDVADLAVLIAMRQLRMWRGWRPWLVSLSLVVPALAGASIAVSIASIVRKYPWPGGTVNVPALLAWMTLSFVLSCGGVGFAARRLARGAWLSVCLVLAGAGVAVSGVPSLAAVVAGGFGLRFALRDRFVGWSAVAGMALLMAAGIAHYQWGWHEALGVAITLWSAVYAGATGVRRVINGGLCCGD